jgi:tetratricopeptide (TPR) repeat protein
MEISEQIRILVKKNKLPGAANLVSQSFLKNLGLQLLLRLNALEEKIQLGIIKEEEATLEKNKISNALLGAADEIEGIVSPRYSQSPKRLNKLPNQPLEFIGRVADLTFVKESFQKNKPILLLNGIGGVGKTTLAKQYLYNHYNSYKHIAWISVLDESNDMDRGYRTIAEALEEDETLLNNLGLDPSRIRKANKNLSKLVLDKLKGLSEGKNLLVIDNAGFSFEEIRGSLPNPPEWHILVTSRKKLPGLYPIHIEELPPEQALELFYLYYPKGKKEESIVNQLLKYIGYHTLTIELFAKSCDISPSTTPQKILQLVHGQQLSELNYKVSSQHSDREVEVYGYLLTVFELTRYELDDIELQVLKQLAVLPSVDFSWELLLRVFHVGKDNQSKFESALIGLVKKGWIIGNEGYKIHQLIQEIIRYKFSATEDNCSSVLKGVFHQLYGLFKNRKEHISYKERDEVELWIKFGEALLFHINSEGQSVSALKEVMKIAYINLGIFYETYIETSKPFNQIKMFNKAIELDPNYSDGYFFLGKGLHFKYSFEESFAKFTRNSKLNPKTEFLNEPLKDKNKLEEIIKCYKKVIELNPKHDQAFLFLGEALRDQGKLNKAIVEFKKAAELDSKLPRIYYNLGCYFFDQQQLDEAAKQLKKAIELSPTDFQLKQLYLRLGLTFTRQGKLLDAIEQYKLLIMLDPNQPSAFNNLGHVLLEQGKLEEAAEQFKEAIELAPQDPTVYFNLGYVLYKQNKLVDSIIQFKKVVELNPIDTDTWNKIGWNYLLLGNLKNAKKYLQKALVNTKNKHALGNLAHIELIRGNKENASDLYFSAFQLYDNLNEFFRAMDQDYLDLEILTEGVSYKEYDDIFQKLGKTEN